MKIAVLSSMRKKEGGGAHTFHETITRQLIDAFRDSPHELVILDRAGKFRGEPTHLGIPVLSLEDDVLGKIQARKKAYQGKHLKHRLSKPFRQLVGKKPRLERESREDYAPAAWKEALQEHGIGLILCLNLRMLPTLDIPYLFNVWDLQHRMQPFFPETTADGEWASREARYREALQRAMFVLTGNAEGAREISLFYGVDPARIRTIPLPPPEIPPELDEAKAVASLAAAGKPLPASYFFYPAQFWPHKNHAGIIRALALLKEQHQQEPHVIFTGSDQGNQAFVREAAQAAGVQNQVHFFGFVERDELYALYRRAEALLFPSYFGPDNLPPLEALSLGLPVLVSDAPGMRLQLGDAARYFQPTDPADIAAAMREVLARDEAFAHRRREGEQLIEGLRQYNYGQALSEVIEECEPYLACWSPRGQ